MFLWWLIYWSLVKGERMWYKWGDHDWFFCKEKLREEWGKKFIDALYVRRLRHTCTCSWRKVSDIHRVRKNDGAIPISNKGCFKGKGRGVVVSEKKMCFTKGKVRRRVGGEGWWSVKKKCASQRGEGQENNFEHGMTCFATPPPLLIMTILLGFA